MSTINYEGRFLTIKSTGKLGRIQHTKTLRGNNGVRVLFIILDEDQKMHELLPHEVNLKDADYQQTPEVELGKDEEAATD